MTPRYDPELATADPIQMTIIGGGPGATEFVHRLNRVLHVDASVVIRIFEATNRFGRGVAWHNWTDSLIANMRLITLGPSYPQFTLIKDILTVLDHPEKDCEYPSRNAMGDALDFRWNQTCKSLPKEWTVEVVTETVLDLIPTPKGIRTITASGTDWPLSHLVVLALGNIPARPKPSFDGSPRVIGNGWDQSALERIGPSDTVLIKGAGLTSIDITIQLLERGHETGTGKITWQSRTGVLPYVRPQQIPLDPAYLKYENLNRLIEEHCHSGQPLTLTDVFSLVIDEIRSQEKDGTLIFHPDSTSAGFTKIFKLLSGPDQGMALIDHGICYANTPSLWFSVAKLLDEYLIPLIWNALSDMDKRVFLDLYRRDFDRFWAAIPVDNAMRIKTWIEEGTIRLLANTCKYRLSDDRNKVCIVGEVLDPLTGKNIKPTPPKQYLDFDYFVDAAGIPADLGTLDSELVQNMKAKGLLAPYVLPPRPEAKKTRPLSVGVLMDWFTGQVTNKDSCPHGWLYSLTGSLTAGAHRFTNSYLAVSASGDRAAVDIAKRISRARGMTKPDWPH